MRTTALWGLLFSLLAACGDSLAQEQVDEDPLEKPRQSQPKPDRADPPSAGDATQTPPAETLADDPQADAFFSKKLGEAGLPGMSAAVIRGGKLKWAKGYGYADVANKKPADKDTLFMLASVSKTLVAVALMSVVEDPSTGVTLDTDISTKLPFAVRNPRYPNTPITVRMLATHTSSLGDYYAYEGSPPGDPQVPLATWAPGYVAKYDNWATWRPGAKWEYSNSATALAALLVQHVTKTDFAEYTKKKIFDPLAMKETAWFLKGLDLAKIAIPYDGIAPAFMPLQHYGYPDYPSGQLRSSAVQMGRFLAMVSSNGAFAGTKVLEPQTVSEMLRMQVPSVESTQGVFFYVQPHATKAGNVSTLGHSGGDFGVSTQMFFDEADGSGYVMLTNASPNAYWANGGVDVPEAMLTARDEIQLELLALAKRIP